MDENTWLVQDLAVEARREANIMLHEDYRAVERLWTPERIASLEFGDPDPTYDRFRAMFVEPNLTESELRALDGNR